MSGKQIRCGPKKKDPLADFLVPADAIVPCRACGAVEGEPCVETPKDKGRLKPGYVHIGRRIKRLLATRGDLDLEAGLLSMLREHLK